MSCYRQNVFIQNEACMAWVCIDWFKYTLSLLCDWLKETVLNGAIK